MSKTVVGSVDYERIKQSASILLEVAPSEKDNEWLVIQDLVNDDLKKISKKHDKYLNDTISKYHDNGQIWGELSKNNKAYRDLITNSNEIAEIWKDVDASVSGEVYGGLKQIDKILGLEGDKSLQEKYSSTSTSKITFYTNAAEVEGFISVTGNISDYYPSLQYRNRSAWKKALIEQYIAQGYSEEDAKELANLAMAEAEIKATGGESHKQALSTIENLRGDYETTTTDNSQETTEEEETTSEEGTNATTTDTNTDDSTSSGNGGRGNSSGNNIQARKTNSGTGNSSSSINSPSQNNNSNSSSNNTSANQNTPSSGTEEKPSSGNDNPVIIEDEEKVPETPSDEKPSTTPDPDNPPSNNNNNNNNGGNSGNNNNNNQGNTGENNNNNNTNNGGAINNNPSNGGNNGYYPPSNNGNGGGSSNGGGYTGGGSSNTPATGAGTPNDNASTTTPSAPDSDAGIIDNSGEGLDVISIDKTPSGKTPSTSSNDGGSVIPTILGVGVAGAAAVAGAKYIKDKKDKSNNYDDDYSTEEKDNSFSYISNYQEQNSENNGNYDAYTSNDNSYSNITETPTKYKAGNVNALVLDDTPAEIKIADDMSQTEQKEELE